MGIFYVYLSQKLAILKTISMLIYKILVYAVGSSIKTKLYTIVLN